MSADQPPRLAIVLLHRLAPANDALAGDLAEEFRRRRSGLWYWRQVTGAIVFGAFREIRDHKAATLRAIALGFTFVWLISRYVMYEILRYDEWLFTRGLIRWFYVNGYGLPAWASWPATAVMFAVSGWIVGRTHRRYGPSMVLAYAAFVESVLCAIGVWRLIYYPSLLHPVSAIFVVAVFQSFACLVPALIGGLLAVGAKDSLGGDIA